jgi:hypothetical protein
MIYSLALTVLAGLLTGVNIGTIIGMRRTARLYSVWVRELTTAWTMAMHAASEALLRPPIDPRPGEPPDEPPHAGPGPIIRL